MIIILWARKVRSSNKEQNFSDFLRLSQFPANILILVQRCVIDRTVEQYD